MLSVGPELARRYRFVAFDRPGSGYSGRAPRHNGSPAVQADLIDSRPAAARRRAAGGRRPLDRRRGRPGPGAGAPRAGRRRRHPRRLRLLGAPLRRPPGTHPDRPRPGPAAAGHRRRAAGPDAGAARAAPRLCARSRRCRLRAGRHEPRRATRSPRGGLGRGRRRRAGLARARAALRRAARADSSPSTASPTRSSRRASRCASASSPPTVSSCCSTTPDTSRTSPGPTPSSRPSTKPGDGRPPRRAATNGRRGATGLIRRGPAGRLPDGRARRGASGALYPQSATAGLNPRPRGRPAGQSADARRRWSGPTQWEPANPVRSGRKQR